MSDIIPTAEVEWTVDAPPHIWGRHHRAIRKHVRIYRNWCRCWKYVRDGRYLRGKNARLARRMKHWDKMTAYWGVDRMQETVPYIKKLEHA